MALQSSGQIKLSEIAAEFGGSAPHALSEYYGDGNAPSSGEIQLAADFYGTSASLNSSNITSGSRTIKGNVTEHGFSAGHANSGTGNDSFGSISNNAISGTSTTIVAVYFRNDTGTDVFRIAFSAAFEAWTSLQVNNASTGAAIVSLNKSQMFKVNNSATRWQYNYGGTGALQPFSGLRAFVLL